MKTLLKLWPLLFIFVNISAQTFLLISYAEVAFYVFLGIALMLIFCKLNIVVSKKTIKTFPFLYILISILILYQLTFGLFFSNEKSWVYLASKVTFTLGIIASISCYPQFNKQSIFQMIAYVVTGVIFLGHFVNNYAFGERMAFGFVNPNSMGSLGALAFGIIILSFKRDSMFKLIKGLCLVFLFVSVVQSGSRSAFGMILLSILFVSRFRIKYLICGILLIVLLIGLTEYLNVDITAVSRFKETVESNEFGQGREKEREAAIMMIQQRPLTGWGLYAVQSKESLKISDFGSHNGYLDFIKMLGIPIASLLFFFMLGCIVKPLKHALLSSDVSLRCNSFIVISILIASMTEGYLWGVNQPVTNLFFISYAVLEYNSNQQIPKHISRKLLR